VRWFEIYVYESTWLNFESTNSQIENIIKYKYFIK
jgi:hypothetical protein